MDTQISIYTLGGVIAFLFLWNVFIQIRLSRFQKKQKELFAGKKGVDLENVIIENKKRIDSLDGDVSDLYQITSSIHNLAHKGLHKSGMLRFNPFRDIGGDQSFALALLDGDDNGIVISSLYSRDGVRVYSKAIQAGQPVKYPLTDEEKQSIQIASKEKNGHKQKRNL